MKKIVIFIIVIILVGAGIWYFTGNDDDGEQNQVENYQPKDYPERPGDAEEAASLTQYQSSLTNLAFSHPENWNVTEGADNTADAQLLTVESPLDINEFYFCLDLNAVSAADEADFAIADAQILATETLESGHQSVIYTVEGLEGLQWGVTDETPAVGDDAFTSQITSETGDRLQVFGRFNCREEAQPDLTKEQFQDARWFQEAKAIINSLEF